ncbi:MAG TPA: hypothetical protein VG324_02970, partial [Blastocatellia bacterium]|nr:hypothetical protein [Blastocatellia bacterium]
HRGAEPEDGLEDRIIANLRQRSRAARPVSWNPAPVIMAAAIVLAFFAFDHLRRRPAASDPAIAAVSSVGEPAARQIGAGVVVGDVLKLQRAFAAARSGSRRRDLAINLNLRRPGQLTESGLLIEEAKISEIRLDDIVISSNARRE